MMEVKLAGVLTTAASGEQKEEGEECNTMQECTKHLDEIAWQGLVAAIANTQERRGVDDSRSRLRSFFSKNIMADEKSIYDWTGFDLEKISLIHAAFEEKWEKMERDEIERRDMSAKERQGKRGPRPKAHIIADRRNNMPLIHDDPLRDGLPGNRCKLEPVQIMLLGLIRQYHNTGEKILGALLGIDQSTVSRYLVPARRILDEILPTARKFQAVIKKVDSPQKFASMFPDGTGDQTVLIDGTHVRFTSSADAEKRDSMVSFKKKFPSGNTVVIASSGGLILGISKTHNGRDHDIAITREFIQELGEFGRMLQGLPGDGRHDAAESTITAAAQSSIQTVAAADMTGSPALAIPALVPPTPQLPAPTPTPQLPSPSLTPSTSSTVSMAQKEDKSEKIIIDLAAMDASKAITQGIHMLFDCAPHILEDITDGMHMLFNSTQIQLDVMDSKRRLLNPPRDQMQVRADSGFQGLKKDLRKADVHHPYKKSKNKKLTQEQKAYNRILSKKRISIENVIGAIKHFKRASAIYSGSLDDFNEEFNIATGLANLRQMFRDGTYNHWAQLLGLRVIDRGGR